MIDTISAWVVDEACANSRPSSRQVHFDGWIIRASDGPVRRTSSTFATRHRTDDYDAVLAVAEGIYASRERASLFRVTSFDNDIDQRLADRGYERDAETRVLLCPSMVRSVVEPDVELTIGHVSDEWINAWATMDERASEIANIEFRRSVGNVVLPMAFACRRIDGELVSLAYGVVHRGLLVVEAVATDVRHRKQGYAFQVISGLFRWAEASNASQACLAVLNDNGPALALYGSLGFHRELYRYHYRRKEFRA